jgi:hypothetical protein
MPSAPGSSGTDSTGDEAAAGGKARRARHVYCVYGVTVSSDEPLDLPQTGCGSLTEIDLTTASAAELAATVDGAEFHPGSDGWYQYAFLADGSTYVRWSDVGEFLVSPDGSQIRHRRDDQASAESFQVYMLGQALSFALIERGFEPLHGTAVVVDGRAVAFLGRSGFGKSSLAASFLEAGHRVLTDDLLIVQRSDKRVLAYPGPPRIKLLPDMAQAFLRNVDCAPPMNSLTTKLIVPLSADQYCATPVPLVALYSLAAPSGNVADDVSIELTSPREAFLELVRNTFNRRLTYPERLQRQLHANTDLANVLTVKRLRHPRVLERLRSVRASIEFDMHCDIGTS